MALLGIIPGIVIFLSIVLGVSGLLHYFVLRRLASLYGWERGAWFYTIVALATTAFLFASVIVAVWENVATRAMYLTAAVMLGAAFIIACVLVIQLVLARFMKLKHRTWRRAVFVASTGFVVAALICGQIIGVERVELRDPRIASELRIVQLTDLHIGAIRSDGHMARVVEQVRTLRPDVVLITGDLIDGRGSFDKATFRRLDEIGVPVYYVTGNHEDYAGNGIVDRMLNGTAVQHIAGMAVEVEGVRFIGVDNQASAAAVSDELERISRDRAIDDTKYTVLLYHRPSGWKGVAGSGVDLMLSGHTHNGQIFPFTLLVPIAERPVHGLHDKDGLSIYVSAGTGTWGPPMRLGSTNEITVINLLPA